MIIWVYLQRYWKISKMTEWHIVGTFEKFHPWSEDNKDYFEDEADLDKQNEIRIGGTEPTVISLLFCMH